MDVRTLDLQMIRSFCRSFESGLKSGNLVIMSDGKVMSCMSRGGLRNTVRDCGGFKCICVGYVRSRRDVTQGK